MKENIELLKQASSEIKMLRHDNQLMRARLDMFDCIMAVLDTNLATKSYGMSEDIAAKLDKTISELNAR